MEYLQVLNTNSDADSDSELQNQHPNVGKKHKQPLPNRAKETLSLRPENEPPLEALDSNFTSFGPTDPSADQTKVAGKKPLALSQLPRGAQSQEKHPDSGTL